MIKGLGSIWGFSCTSYGFAWTAWFYYYFWKICVFVQIDHAGVLKKENGFQNYLFEFLLGVSAHVFN